MAGNVTAFNTVWTYDIYQSYLKKDASDGHYLWVGRISRCPEHRVLVNRLLNGSPPTVMKKRRCCMNDAAA